MTTQRLFVALPIPAHVRVLAEAAAAPARELAPELTWTRPGGWHVTLAFLGEVPAEDVRGVEAAVADAVAGRAPVRCELGAAGRFDRRVLWLAVHDRPDGAVAALGSTVQHGLAAAGLPVTERVVRPHLTLARASRGGAAIDDHVVASVAPVAASWEAGEVELVRAHLGDGPARYEPVGAWSLVDG